MAFFDFLKSDEKTKIFDTRITRETRYLNLDTMKPVNNPPDFLDYGIQHNDKHGKPVEGMTLNDQGRPDKQSFRMKPYIEKYGPTMPTPKIKTELADLSSGYFSEELFLHLLKSYVRFVRGTRLDRKLILTTLGFLSQNSIYIYNDGKDGDLQYIYSFKQQPAQYEIYIGADDEGSVNELIFFHNVYESEMKIPLIAHGILYVFMEIFRDTNGIAFDDIIMSSEAQKILDSLSD